MEEAERIAREEHGSTKISVISGVGTRHYYRKLGILSYFILFYHILLLLFEFHSINYLIGYELDGPYMSKML